ncbi:hypothetical protein [Caballeronia arvi]|uniref:hypothetical protein n=1 Tax=Caballeronia arvi TaxID=1777135 RepID=UPI00190E99EB|nr:hypothetical protein [Caballeronia arvi]
MCPTRSACSTAALSDRKISHGDKHVAHTAEDQFIEILVHYLILKIARPLRRHAVPESREFSDAVTIGKRRNIPKLERKGLRVNEKCQKRRRANDIRHDRYASLIIQITEKRDRVRSFQR